MILPQTNEVTPRLSLLAARDDYKGVTCASPCAQCGLKKTTLADVQGLLYQIDPFQQYCLYSGGSDNADAADNWSLAGGCGRNNAAIWIQSFVSIITSPFLLTSLSLFAKSHSFSPVFILPIPSTFLLLLFCFRSSFSWYLYSSSSGFRPIMNSRSLGPHRTKKNGALMEQIFGWQFTLLDWYVRLVPTLHFSGMSGLMTRTDLSRWVVQLVVLREMAAPLEDLSGI